MDSYGPIVRVPCFVLSSLSIQLAGVGEVKQTEGAEVGWE